MYKKLNSEIEQRGSCQGLGGKGNRERLVEGNKLSVIKWIGSEDLKYNMVTVANNVLYNWTLLGK